MQKQHSALHASQGRAEMELQQLAASKDAADKQAAFAEQQLGEAIAACRCQPA